MDAAEAGDLPAELAFVDLETTGGNAAHDRVTEVGVVRLHADGSIDEWSTLVNPGCRIPPYIESFTGITNEMVAGAPEFAAVAADVQHRLRGALFVAHNARFDYSFLRNEFRRIDADFQARVLCTVKLSRRLYPRQHRHGLDAIIARHGLACAARHRALGDARVLLDFWGRLRADWPAAELAAAIRALLSARVLPPQLDAGLADELPEGPGVYRFLGEGDALLYVGKSVTLRTRVLAHFAAEHRHGTDARIAQAVRRVDWRETAGELGALLIENAWIKRFRPLLNRRLKSTAANVTLRFGEAPGSALRVEPVDAVPRGESFGLFRSARDATRAVAEIARSQSLCLKMLQLEDAEGSCFAYQVGKCRGACVGAEPAVMHSLRARLALAALKLQPWPFPGRIALRERGALGATDWHVLDDWGYVGTARDDDELQALAQEAAPAAFDADVYRILARWFATHRDHDWRSLAAPEAAQ